MKEIEMHVVFVAIESDCEESLCTFSDLCTFSEGNFKYYNFLVEMQRYCKYPYNNRYPIVIF
jgi:hypothetical protein